MRIIMNSCEGRESLQRLAAIFREKHWPDCPYPTDVLSPDREKDLGWNANLARHLLTLSDELVLIMLDDHFIGPPEDQNYTENLERVRELMLRRTDIGLIKVQRWNAWSPELSFPEWDRLGEYDREPHPFKRTNLVPTVFRVSFLKRLLTVVLNQCGPQEDVGRLGAIHLEVYGTAATALRSQFPERLLGIARDQGQVCLLTCLFGDAVREGKMRPELLESIRPEIEAVRNLGVERFL